MLIYKILRRPEWDAFRALDLARVKSVVVRAVSRRGAAVLNADQPPSSLYANNAADDASDGNADEDVNTDDAQ